MNVAATLAPRVEPVHEPAQLRSSTYRLLAHLMSGAPTAELLASLAEQIQPGGQDREIDRAWSALRDAARDHDAGQWRREYNALFVGVGEGELTPYGSFYICGKVMDKPLAKLRGALRMLGIERQPGAVEPEDHVAGVCEVLALLAEDPDMSVEGQHSFYQAHVQGWLPRFFKDLDRAASANAYRSVAALGVAFLALDEQYLSMLA